MLRKTVKTPILTPSWTKSNSSAKCNKTAISKLKTSFLRLSRNFPISRNSLINQQHNTIKINKPHQKSLTKHPSSDSQAWLRQSTVRKERKTHKRKTDG
jgi:hypothetical protein